MVCTECHVRKGPELAQVSFDPAALFELMPVKSTVKFLLTNMVLKEAGKVILPISVIQIRVFTSHVKMISHYASVIFFLTHTVVTEANVYE